LLLALAVEFGDEGLHGGDAPEHAVLARAAVAHGEALIHEAAQIPADLGELATVIDGMRLNRERVHPAFRRVVLERHVELLFGAVGRRSARGLVRLIGQAAKMQTVGHGLHEHVEPVVVARADDGTRANAGFLEQSGDEMAPGAIV